MQYMNALFFLASAVTIRGDHASLLMDVNEISKYWGTLSPYTENSGNSFGIQHTGLPEGCQIENVNTLQRHAERFPTYGELDGTIERFSQLVANFTSKSRLGDQFTGPLSFLNSWQLINNRHGLLTGIGATTMFAAGNSFWNQYGRTLYDASAGQLAYNPNFPNGTARPPVILRTTNQSRMHNSQINWALGFFGSTTKNVPNPLIENTTRPYKVVVIPEGGKRDQNNTLAPYDNCFRASKQDVRSIGNTLASRYMLTYLEAATKRLQNFAPADFKLSVNDTFAMQNLCAYEHAFIRQSEFCGFFTEEEWAGFEHALDIKFYYMSSFGSPMGRALGIGYVEELLARLNHSFITTSSSSVNLTLDSDPATFPTDQPFYADFTHDTIITATLAALSIDYFRDTPSLTQFPPNADRKFRISKIAPFGARLVTETIGCSSANPSPRKNARIQYSPSQYGYNASTASHKFIRMRLNNGIIPLSTIRGGACGNSETGRVDGMCALEDFVRSQENATALANFQYACNGNYTIPDRFSGKDWDGTIFP